MLAATIGIILGGSAVGTSIATLLAAIHEKHKMTDKVDDLAKKCDKIVRMTEKAVSDLADATPVTIREDLIERAVNKAVDREVRFAVDKAVSQVKSDIRNEVESEVRKEIRTQRDHLIDDVDRKLTDEVEKLSREDIAADVQKKVTGIIIDRMDKDLSDIKERYSRKLDENVKELTRSCRNRLDDIVRDYDNKSYIVWRART